MATDKRERQRSARLGRISAEATAAKRTRTRGNALRIVIAAVVVVAVVFAASQIMGDDDDGASGADGGDRAATTSTAPGYADQRLADEVLARRPPVPRPPPAGTAADALETSTLIPGEGRAAVAGDTVTVHYVGVLSDGTEFDQSWKRGDPFPVVLGRGDVIAGWDEGLVGARIGERRHLVIGPGKAYGAQGQGSIPPNAPLAFDVDVVDVRPGTPGEGGSAGGGR
ncbi:MAG TPA: FKBP-type peptidyl-prolyl cis-trans isomerase [Acidimicrobiales bacterium]|nr:FKBP-type peptidyl-prolyl cis-trans isomerase [Acidimicrobiales bacterium]